MKHTKEFKIKIGQVFKDDKRDLVVIDREYRVDKRNSPVKWYKIKCNKCGWKEGWKPEGELFRGVGCSVCCPAPRIAVLGINTIWDTDRWLVDLGVSEEYAKTHTRGSNKRATVKCPYCGREKDMLIGNIRKKKSISCNCGDGFSFNEKVVSSILNQLNIEHKAQLTKVTFEWCGNYRYDFYIPSINTIIECHGLQHYEDNTAFKASLKETQENDKKKYELAKENNIDNYIVIDCRKSNLEWIKNNILNSKLNNIFDLSNIDWLECEKFALNSLVWEVCQYWNNKQHWETSNELAEVFGLNRWTISKYLRKGNSLNWCFYNGKEERIKGARLYQNKGVEIFKEGNSLGTFESARELSRRSQELFGVYLDYSAITQVCKGKRKTSKGFTFKYSKNNKLNKVS